MRMKLIIGAAVLLFNLIGLKSRGQEDSLSKKSITLHEVVVQSDTRLRNTKEKRQGADLQISTDQLLESIAGVNMIRRGGYAWEPTVRGLNAGQINVTISGMAIFGACTDRMDPASSYIEPNNLQSIAVSYGANNQTYGSTIGGGFNFKLKQPRLDNEQKITGLAGVGYETNAHSVQTLAALEYSDKRFAVRGNGIFRRAGNYTAGGGKEVSFSQYSKWNGGIGAVYQLAPRHHLYADYIQDEGWDIGYPALLMDVAFAKAKIGSLTYQYKPDNDRLHSWETRWYYNIINHAMDDTKRPKDQVPVHMDMPGTSQTVGFYSEAKWGLDSRNHLTTRLNGYSNRLHAEMTMYPENAAPMFMLTIPDARRDVIGLDVSNKSEVSPKIELIMGVRTEYSGSSIYSAEGKQLLSGIHQGSLNRSHLLLNAYVNGQYRFSDRWMVYTNIAKGMRSATLQELYGFYLFNRMDGYDYIGNPELKNESSWNLGTGARFQKKVITMEGQVFAYLFNNYIAGHPLADYSVMTTGAYGVKQYSNISSAVLYGAEVTVLVKPLSFLQVKSTNTYNRGQDVKRRPLPLIAPFRSESTISVIVKGYRFDATPVYSAAQNRVSYEGYGELPSKAFFIMNTGIGKTVKIKPVDLDLNLRVLNIFDSYYYEHLDILKIPRPGRNIEIHATIRF